MTLRDDMFAALRRRQPQGVVPLWEIEFQGWDAASGGHVILGREFEALSRAQQEAALHRNAEIMLRVSAQMHFAALTAPNSYWNQAPDQLAYYVLPGDWRFEQMRVLRQMAGSELVLVGNSGGIIGADYSESWCARIFEEPQSVDAIARERVQLGIETAQRFRDAGADVVFSASDMADNSGPFYNPKQMERWVYPFLTQWSQSVHAMGMYSILHSDGNLSPYLSRLADTGLDGLQAIDPVAGMDLRQTKDAVGGRLCLCGNVDCGRLLRDTPEEVYRITRDLLETCKAGGGLVLGASNAVQPDVPLVNYRAMIQAWEDHGRYGAGGSASEESRRTRGSASRG
jgi:uroporphyrinogen decarboxylase